MRHYQNDDAEPKIGDMVTAIEFVGDDEVLFYKGEIHEQVLIDERVRINRKVTNVFMGVFCGVFLWCILFVGRKKNQGEMWLLLMLAETDFRQFVSEAASAAFFLSE